MPRTFALFLLALSSLCFAQDDIFADGFNNPHIHHCEPMSAQRSNLAVIIAPAAGGSDLKLRMSIADMPVRKGEALQGALVGQGGTAPYVYPPITGLPPGVSLNSTTGILSGTPTTVGKYDFLAEVQDAALGDYKCKFSINVIPPLQVTSQSPLDSEANLAYDFQITVSGNTGAVSFTTSPAFHGISLDSSGLLSGTTASIVANDTTIISTTITDAGSGDSIVYNFPFTVRKRVTMVLESASGTVEAGVPFTLVWRTDGGVGPFVYDLSPFSVLSWLTIATTPGSYSNDGTVTFSGTPPVGTYTNGLYIMNNFGTVTSSYGTGYPVNLDWSITNHALGKAQNLSDLSSIPTARANLGLSIVPVSFGSVGASATLSHDINRFTAINVVGTTPASPVDFQEIEILIEDASFTGCSLAAHSGQTVNGGSSFSFSILPCVFRFRYNLAATNWFVTYYRIGTI